MARDTLQDEENKNLVDGKNFEVLSNFQGLENFTDACDLFIAQQIGLRKQVAHQLQHLLDEKALAKKGINVYAKEFQFDNLPFNIKRELGLEANIDVAFRKAKKEAELSNSIKKVSWLVRVGPLSV